MTASRPPHAYESLPDAKAELRRRMRDARAALPPEARTAAAAAVSEALLGLDELRGTGPVLLYAACPKIYLILHFRVIEGVEQRPAVCIRFETIN
jgi:hypothetical protein